MNLKLNLFHVYGFYNARIYFSRMEFIEGKPQLTQNRKNEISFTKDKMVLNVFSIKYKVNLMNNVVTVITVFPCYTVRYL